MSPFCFLFVPALGRPLAEALRSAAVLPTLMEAVGRPDSSPAGTGAGLRDGVSHPGNLRLALLLGTAGHGLTAIPSRGMASAQATDRGLFADTESATREVLVFLGGLGT